MCGSVIWCSMCASLFVCLFLGKFYFIQKVNVFLLTTSDLAHILAEMCKFQFHLRRRVCKLSHVCVLVELYDGGFV